MTENLLLLIFLFSFMPSSFPSCLSVNRQRGDSKSPHRKLIHLRESARQGGRGFLIWIYLRISAKQSLTCFHHPTLFLLHHHHLHRCGCMTRVWKPPLCQFVRFPLWFCFRWGLWRLWYTEIPVSSWRSFSQIPPLTSSPYPLVSPEQKITPFTLLPPPPPPPFGCPKSVPLGQIPDIKVSIEEPSVRYQLMWDTTN